MNDYSAVQPQDITLSGHRVHFRTGGSGPHILLLHTAWGDAEMSWASVWSELSQSFTVIAPDLPGFGHSSALSRPSLSAMVHLIKQLLETLNTDHVIAVGNSFGAAVAIQFAGIYPKATSYLVLVNGGYPPLIPGPIRKLLAVPPLKQGFGLLGRYLSYSKRALKAAFADPSKLPPGFFEKIRQNAGAYSRIVRDTWMNMTEPMVRPACPTLLLWGYRDRLTPMKYAHALEEWIPGASLITVEGAGHMPQVERPEEFLSAILNLQIGAATEGLSSRSLQSANRNKGESRN